jgi:hypothetical protein
MGTKIVDRGWKKIKRELNILGSSEIVIGVMGGLEYAPYLEFGTVKMTAKPFMRHTFEQYGSVMQAQIATSYSSVIAGGSANKEANKLGLFYQGRIQRTIRAKGLIDTGRLIGSVSYELR